MYDCAIVGTGPAGISAAMNLKLHNKSLIWFGTESLSAKISSAEKIANYPGLPFISGGDFSIALKEHIQQMGLTITDKMVTLITAVGNEFMLLADNEIFKAKTVILAPGVATTKHFTGESDFVGRGVSYCATCDGFLYKGKTIAVYSKSKRFEHEVEYLASMANTVYFIPGYENFSIAADNVQIIPRKCTAVEGDLKITNLHLDDGSDLKIDGFFILRDAIAPTTLLPGLEVKDGRIVVDRGMNTNIPGCFACGDCTGAPYQYTKAVGEGNVAAHSAIRYLSAL